MKALVLLLECLPFPDIGKEELLSQVSAVTMYLEGMLKYCCCILVLSERSEDEDKVLDCEGVSHGLHSFDVCQNFFAISFLPLLP